MGSMCVTGVCANTPQGQLCPIGGLPPDSCAAKRGGAVWHRRDFASTVGLEAATLSVVSVSLGRLRVVRVPRARMTEYCTGRPWSSGSLTLWSIRTPTLYRRGRQWLYCKM